MKKMVLLATVVGVVALIMAAAPAMAMDRDGHDGAFNNGGVILQNGNVGFNTGLGFNGCCNTGFVDGCCNTGFFDRDDFFCCNQNNFFDRDDFFCCNQNNFFDRDDFRRNNDLDDFRHNHDMDRR